MEIGILNLTKNGKTERFEVGKLQETDLGKSRVKWILVTGKVGRNRDALIQFENGVNRTKPLRNYDDVELVALKLMEIKDV